MPLSPAAQQWGDMAPPPHPIALLSVMGGVVGQGRESGHLPGERSVQPGKPELGRNRLLLPPG